jgi:hypothetical protein
LRTITMIPTLRLNKIRRHHPRKNHSLACTFSIGRCTSR